ncbi:MAG: phage holin family protein [Candidatus Nanopelagicales bacterium]
MSTNGSDPTIRQLVQSVAADAQRLAKAQTELARTEIKSTEQDVAATGGMFVGAAVTGFLTLVFLLITLAYVLVAVGLPVWAGFGIVTLLLIIVTAILGLLGRKRARTISGPKLAKSEFERTKQLLSGSKPEVLPVPRSSDAVAQRAGDVRAS